MNIKDTKYELQNLLLGKSSSSYDPIAQKAASYLRRSQKTGSIYARKHQDNLEEIVRLLEFARINGLLIPEDEKNDFVSKKNNK